MSRPLLKLLAATLALAAIAAPAAAAKAPGPIAGKGYHLAFHDDFSHFRKHVWTRKIWYDDPPPRHAIHTKSGVLHLVSRRNQGYPDITVTTLKSRSFRHGYFEARMRWTKGLGAWPAFWLVSTRHAKNPAFPSLNPYCANHGLPEVRCWNSELDVFEGQGAEPHTFYGTLHRNTNDYYGASDSTNNPAWKSLGADMTKGFHRYAVLWTASEVRWYFDGHQVLRAPDFRLDRPADVPPLRHVDRLGRHPGRVDPGQSPNEGRLGKGLASLSDFPGALLPFRTPPVGDAG